MSKRLISTGIKVKLITIDSATGQVVSEYIRRVRDEDMDSFKRALVTINKPSSFRIYRYETIEESVDIAVDDIDLTVMVEFPDTASRFVTFKEISDLENTNIFKIKENSFLNSKYGGVQMILDIACSYVLRENIPNFDPLCSETVGLFEILKEENLINRAEYEEYIDDHGKDKLVYKEEINQYIVKIENITVNYNNKKYNGSDR